MFSKRILLSSLSVDDTVVERVGDPEALADAGFSDVLSFDVKTIFHEQFRGSSATNGGSGGGDDALSSCAEIRPLQIAVQNTRKSKAALFINRLQVLGNHFAGVTVDGHVQPIPTFPLDIELVELASVVGIAASLGN